jgi:hypothetical protein
MARKVQEKEVEKRGELGKGRKEQERDRNANVKILNPTFYSKLTPNITTFLNRMHCVGLERLLLQFVRTPKGLSGVL